MGGARGSQRALGHRAAALAALARARAPLPMTRMADARGDAAWRLLYCVYVATLGVLHGLVMRAVPAPYMDEPFHVAQTAEYCAGRWAVWDEKITTFPGLYLLGAAAAAATRGLATLGGRCKRHTTEDAWCFRT